MTNHDLPGIVRRGRPGPLETFRSNPLFGAAALMLLAIVGTAVWLVLREYTGPTKFVTVDTFSVYLSATVSDISVDVARVTYQPGYNVRLSPTLRDRSGPMLLIDGTIENKSSRPVGAYLPAEGLNGPAVISAPGGRSAATVSILAATVCANSSAATSILAPSERTRFSVELPDVGDSSLAWVIAEIKAGSFPSLSLGDFTAHPDCASIKADPTGAERWRIDFPRTDLPQVERQDFYPFGAPTAQEIGVNGRRYWSRWLPRPGN